MKVLKSFDEAIGKTVKKIYDCDCGEFAIVFNDDTCIVAELEEDDYVVVEEDCIKRSYTGYQIGLVSYGKMRKNQNEVKADDIKEEISLLEEKIERLKNELK